MTSDLIAELDPRYAAALAQLAADQGMSELNVIRAALRVYQLVHVRAKEGYSLAFTDAEGRVLPPNAMRLRMKAGVSEN
jgi:hypothetical protein